jgi:hypothetical protein
MAWHCGHAQLHPLSFIICSNFLSLRTVLVIFPIRSFGFDYCTYSLLVTSNNEEEVEEAGRGAEWGQRHINIPLFSTAGDLVALRL